VRASRCLRGIAWKFSGSRSSLVATRFWYAPPRSVHNRFRLPLLARAARSAGSTTPAVDPAAPLSILSLAAASYGARPSEDMTIPTGFDPAAVVLFEAIIEGAYLVANADDVFDDEERRAFERVVVEACDGTVSSQQIASLVDDLDSQLRNEGIDRRIESLASSVSKKEHAQEVLRVAALVAQASEGASAIERTVLSKLAARCGLPSGDVDAALAGAKNALASPL
jgi:tellurite resistance protein